MIKKFIFCILPSSAFATVSNGPYVGLEGGISNQIVIFNANTTLNNANNNSYSSSASAAIRLNIGYNFNRYSGIELGGNYIFSNSMTAPNGNNFATSNTAVDVSYLLNLPTVFDGLSIFGRVGGAYSWLNASSCNCSSDNLSNGLTDALGAGVRYNITSKTSFRVEWLENGLIFPIQIKNNSQNTASWTNQMFLTGINVSY